MATPNLGGRKFYQTSGRADWARFVPLSVAAVMTAAALAVLLCFLFHWGFYFLVVMPVLAALGVAGMVMLAVHKGHCRSRRLGLVLGLLAGVVLYVGYYYASMIRDLGWEVAGDFQLFPRYVELRLQTDVIRHEGEPEPDQHDVRPHPERVYFNSAVSAFEFGFVLVITGGAGWRRARRTYCEQCRTWMKRETTTFMPEVGPAFLEALRLGSVQSLAALFTSPVKPGAPQTGVAVDYCPNLREGKAADCPMYLSVKQITAAAKGLNLDPFERAKGKMLARHVWLSPGEIPALLSRFASLETVAGTTAAAALEELQVEVKPRDSLVMIEVRPVDPQFAGRVLTKKNKLTCAALMIGSFALFVTAFVVLILGGMTAFPDHPPEGGVSSGVKLFGEIVMGAGIVLLIPALVLLVTRPDLLATRHMRRAALREFGRRPNPVVKPDDPEACFVQIVPRANWGKLKLEDAADIGFLKADPQKGEVLFEGDKEYYRIPAAAIVSCEVETFISGEGTHAATKLYRVVLQANHPSGFWEAPVAQRSGAGLFQTKKRAKWASEMRAKIRAVMSSPSPT